MKQNLKLWLSLFSFPSAKFDDRDVAILLITILEDARFQLTLFNMKGGGLPSSHSESGGAQQPAGSSSRLIWKTVQLLFEVSRRGRTSIRLRW